MLLRVSKRRVEFYVTQLTFSTLKQDLCGRSQLPTGWLKVLSWQVKYTSERKDILLVCFEDLRCCSSLAIKSIPCIAISSNFKKSSLFFYIIYIIVLSQQNETHENEIDICKHTILNFSWTTNCPVCLHVTPSLVFSWLFPGGSTEKALHRSLLPIIITAGQHPQTARKWKRNV